MWVRSVRDTDRRRCMVALCVSRWYSVAPQLGVPKKFEQKSSNKKKRKFEQKKLSYVSPYWWDHCMTGWFSNKKVRTKKFEQNSPNKTVRTKQSKQNSPNKWARTNASSNKRELEQTRARTNASSNKRELEQTSLNKLNEFEQRLGRFEQR